MNFTVPPLFVDLSPLSGNRRDARPSLIVVTGDPHPPCRTAMDAIVETPASSAFTNAVTAVALWETNPFHSE